MKDCGKESTYITSILSLTLSDANLWRSDKREMKTIHSVEPAPLYARCVIAPSPYEDSAMTEVPGRGSSS